MEGHRAPGRQGGSPVAVGLVFTPISLAVTSWDSIFYLTSASDIASGADLNPTRIGFTLPLAIVLKPFADPLVGAVVFVRAVFFATVVLFWFIGRRLAGYTGAFLFPTLLLCNGLFHYANLRLLLDGFQPLVTLGGIYAAWAALRRESLPLACLSAALIFYSLLIKVATLFCIAIPLIYLALTPRLWRSGRVGV